MSTNELLQQIVTNTAPLKTTMTSATSTNPEFSVNFPTAIPVKEIALAQLRVYYSWPNIRSKPFGGVPSNNSLVFANKNKDDGTPDWQVASIPTGSYQIEQINDEFQRKIKSITGKESKIAIAVHEPMFSAAIEINSQDYSVDIYQSSIRTVLGWPEVAPVHQREKFLPRPLRDNYTTDEKRYNGENTFFDYSPLLLSDQQWKDDIWNFVVNVPAPKPYTGKEIGWIFKYRDNEKAFNLDKIMKLFDNMISIYNYYINELRNKFRNYIIEYPNEDIRNEIIKNVRTINKVEEDIKLTNNKFVRHIIDLTDNKH